MNIDCNEVHSYLMTHIVRHIVTFLSFLPLDPFFLDTLSPPTSSRLHTGEGDACILALMQLRSAVIDYPILELRTMKQLVCNFKAWSRCTYKFQTSLVGVVATTVNAQPEYFQAHIGVQGK